MSEKAGEVRALEKAADKLKQQVGEVLHNGAFLQISRQFAPELIEIFGLNVSCYEELRKALKNFFRESGKLEVMRSHVQQVSDLESEIDQKQAELTRSVFGSNQELAMKIHFCQLLSLVCSLSDKSEDIGEELEAIAMRVVI